ncbi:GNAT family N-acetyltransferase [Lignipirellula cremea]|uniref:Putative acetyltransferase n=1 Tax=Lignipirellula cremea TaxID=2528010 RepID=A0A518E2S6_9BACT|nr:GNAT family N-acetyltransferase [Lignipirellula cremea]QDU98373.1 putative acetyltransferase [Lignipirellula cremea]
MSDFLIRPADLQAQADQQAILHLTEVMSYDSPGSPQPLPAAVKQKLIQGLQAMPTTLILLAWRQDQAVGAAVCFWGFSTFAAQRVLNVHDLIVQAENRGQGIGKLLLAAVEQAARAGDACKVTLEVDEENAGARRLYAQLGYVGADTPGKAGRTFFLAKRLAPV